MKRFVVVLAVLFVVALPTAVSADILVNVYASPAPNGFGSPSWSGYLANAMNALQNGLSVVGDRETDPTAYSALVRYFPGDVMVTSFSSWRGISEPPAPFNGEYGNRMHFGLVALGDGLEWFTLANVQFAILSSDGQLNYIGSLVGTTLNGTTRVGVNYGPDRVLGGGDDIVYNSGESDSTVLDALYYVGVGNGYWPGGTTPDQAILDETAEYIRTENIIISGGYSVNGYQNSGTTTVVLWTPDIFRDGFETGDMSRWTGAVMESPFAPGRVIPEPKGFMPTWPSQ
ncbi:MAG: hypothetical protein NUW02_00190 [Candidatus Campbellbacteria bacterium]|nr:hypothetical protein [Candidatus Campbellbacteria bacterium]